VAVTGLVVLPTAHAAWPVKQVDKQHPIRGGFMDPRHGNNDKKGYHGAVDVAVREDLPTNAPPGAVAKVYALKAGPVIRTTVGHRHPCGRIKIGDVTYGHISLLRVKVGRQVRVGQWIGWTCRGLWHIHIMEFDRFNTKVNPMRPGGILGPFEDTADPVVKNIRIEDGELHARIEDPQSFHGWFTKVPRLYNDLAPYEIAVDGTTIWRFDTVPLVPFDSVYAPGTVRNLPARTCLRRSGPCGGRHWFRLGNISSGTHTVEAWDVKGNHVLVEFDVSPAALLTPGTTNIAFR
jgi:hypothetical protein